MVRYAFLLFILFSGCSARPDAQSIINKAIEKHGGKAYENSRMAFTFRNIRYTAEQQQERFEFTRTINDSTGAFTDRLTNTGFIRISDGNKLSLSSADSADYANALNSVIYFARLPYKLNDAAVNKTYLGETTIRGEPYYKIQVDFKQQGGGKDHEDTYIYWIQRDDYTMDYLAYRFHVDEGGTRFREAKNVRTVNGIRFADYNNFGGADMERPLERYDTFFEQDELEKVSEVNLKDIEVRRLNEDY